MTNGNSLEVVAGDTLLKLVSSGDTSSLSGEQKLAYYRARCEAAGIDPRTAPFQFIKLQGKETLYATKAATDQLASNNKIKLEVISQTTEQDIRVVMVRAISSDGRQTDEMGAVPVGGVKGADLANAYMKAITKAKRRAILSLCGLGMLDETEIETIQRTSPGTHVPEVQMPKRASAAVEQLEAKAPGTGQEPRKISLDQAKRFFAICKGAGKSDVEMKDYLTKLGIPKSTEMPVELYDKACEWGATRPAIVNTATGEIGPGPDLLETSGVGE